MLHYGPTLPAKSPQNFTNGPVLPTVMIRFHVYSHGKSMLIIIIFFTLALDYRKVVNAA